MLEVFIEVSSVLLPVFAIMGLGAYFMHSDTLTEQGNENLKAMVYKVLMPIMVFAYLVKNPLDIRQGLVYIQVVFVYATVLSVLCYAGAYAFLYRNPRLAVFSSTTFIFPNNIYLGIPICAFAFGDSAVLPAVMFGIVFYVVPFYVLVGVQVTNGNSRHSPHRPHRPLRRLWAAFVGVASNPIFIGAILGVIWGQWGMRMPVMVDRTVGLVSDANKMLALLTVGASLYSIYHDKSCLAVTAKVSFRTELIWVNVIKMILFPLLSLGVIQFFAVPPLWQAVFVLQSAMPFGVFVYFIACAERVFVRQLSVHVLVSTLVSMAVLPLYIVVLWSVFDV